MAALEVHEDALVVTLTGWERVAAMRRELRVPLTAVRGVCADPDPWSALRGVRVEGSGIPGMAVYGVRRMTGDRPDFAALHGRGTAVRVELTSRSRYRRLLVSVADPEATVAAVRTKIRPTRAA